MPAPHSQHTYIKATGACLGALVLWSTGPIFIEYLTGSIDAWTQNALRYSVACIFWLPFLGISLTKRTLDARVWRLALLPLLPNILMQTLWAWSYYHGDPAFIVLITKTNVLWIAGLSLLIFPQERVLARSPRFWAGLVLSGAGVTGVVLSGRTAVTASHHTATIIALVCALFHAIYALTVRMAFRNIDSRQGFSVVSIYTCLGLWIPALCFGHVGQCLTMGGFPWICVILSGITAIAIGHTLYYLAIRHVGATLPSLVILAQPFVVLVISRFVFSEVLTTAQILFGLILLVGAALAIWAQQDLRRG